MILEKYVQHYLHFVTRLIRNMEHTHYIYWNSLVHRLYHNLFIGIGQRFRKPSLGVLCHAFFSVSERSLLISLEKKVVSQDTALHCCIQPQKNIHNLVPSRNIGTKNQPRLVEINGLT